MSTDLSLVVHNYSKIFGGQERYLESLIHELANNEIKYWFIGAPDRLTQLNKDQISIASESLSVEILNGNRSLYKLGWHSSKSDIRVYVQHSHINDAQGHPVKRWVRKVLLRLLLKRMDVVIRVCEHALPDYFAPGKIHTVYNGVSLPTLPEGHSSQRPFTLLMVGAVNDNKNQFLALQLLEQDPDLHLLVVGDGEKLLALKQWARDKGLEARVRWTGFVDDPSSYYLQADALLMLSAFEAFPYAVLEAMSFALPVVATRVGGVPEAITHEIDGLLLPSRDLPSLNAAVHRLKADPKWRKQLGDKARQTVSERFTVERMTDNLLHVIDDAARQKGLIA